MNMTNLLAALVAALAFNELIHLVFEIWGIRQKVTWLTARIDHKPHGNWPVNIDTLGKTLLLHGVMFATITCLFFGIMLWLELPTQTLLLVAVVLLVVAYSFTTFGMDGYHREIGRLLKRFERPNTKNHKLN